MSGFLQHVAGPGAHTLRKIAVAAVVGLAAFAASAVLDGPLQVSLADQLILTTVAGAVALMAQLADFDAQLRGLRQESGAALARLDTGVQSHLESLRAGAAPASSARSVPAVRSATRARTASGSSGSPPPRARRSTRSAS
jgi:hypothetical protein